MLKTMRKNVKALKPTLWFVIGAFIISIFVIWGGAGRLGEGEKSSLIAEIGKEKLTGEEYFNALRNQIERLKSGSTAMTINRQLLEQLNIPQQVLEQMVEQALLFDLASEMGIRASDQELKDRIVTLPGLQRDGAFIGYDEYKRVLSYNRLSIGEFENSLRREIVLSKVVKILTAGISATPAEIWDNYVKTKESAKIEYLALETSKVEVKDKPSEADVRAHFEAHQETYKIPEKREALTVFFKNEDLKKEIELSESDIEKYYEDNKPQFEIPEKVKVARIWLPFAGKEKAQVEAEAGNVLGRLAKGEAFDGLAKTFSKDDKAAGGGDWGLYDWQTLPAKEQEAIKKLGSGAVSEAVAGDDGIAILKVAEKTAATTTPLAEAKPQIRTILLDQRARGLAAERIGKIEKDAKKLKSLESAAKAANLAPAMTGLLKSGDPFGDVDPSGAVSTALASMKEKEISAPIYTYAGVGLAELRRVEAARPAQFEEVRAEVEKDAEESRKKDRALATIREVRSKLTEKNWEDLAAKYKLEIKTVDEHKREQYLSVIGESKAVDDFAFAAPLKQASEPIAFETGYALLRVLDRKAATKEEFTKEKDAETEAFLEQKKNRFLQSYLARRRTEKNVKVNYDQFLQISQDILSRYDSGQ